MDPDKITEDVGEQPRHRPARVSLRVSVRPYLWDKHLVRAAGWAVLAGSGRIIALTWQWCRSAPPGDRLWRGCGVLGGVGLGVYYAYPYAPGLVPGGIVTAWIVAALCLAPREVWKPPAPAHEAPAVDRSGAIRDALLGLLEVHTRGRNGIHLGELHQILTRTQAYKALPKKGVAPLLEEHGIPVVRAMSVAGIAGRSGVRRTAVEALLQARSPDPVEGHSQPAQSAADLHVSQSFSAGSHVVLGPVSKGV